MSKPRLPSRVQEALETVGLPWELVNGNKHIQIRVAGRLAGVLPRNGTGAPRSVLNTVAQIRRIAKEVS